MPRQKSGSGPDCFPRTPPALTRVTIERLGQRGEGVAMYEGGRVYVPFVLPGETVSIDRENERGTLIGLLTPSPDRIAPICPYFTTCGGCAVQAWAAAPYAEWKRGLLVDALSRAGVTAEVAPLVDAHGAGRRRATFHARVEADGRSDVGYMRARSHSIVAIEACPILDPALDGALPAARAIAATLAGRAKPLDIIVAASEAGLDIDLRGHGPVDDGERRRLVALAAAHDLARLSNHGVIVIERRKPTLSIGLARVEPPPGAFQQATAAGEAALAARIMDALRGIARTADLFSGLGTFALRIAATSEVTAYESDAAALAALDRAARDTPGLRAVRVERRDLYARPLAADELKRLDALLLDPPRAGAEAQMREIVASPLERVVYVSCDVGTFARDAAILAGGGFEVEGEILPIDQFRYSPHLEMVGVFRRPPAKRKRRLLS